MDIFDRARKALGDLAQTASTQARVLQLQTRMGEIEAELERQYAEAGRRAKELWRQRAFADTDFEVLMNRVRSLEQELEQLRLEMGQVQQAATTPRPGVCRECGRALEPEDRFCRGCGAQVPPTPPAPP